jgi:hypothetical protein
MLSDVNVRHIYFNTEWIHSKKDDTRDETDLHGPKQQHFPESQLVLDPAESEKNLAFSDAC